MWPRVLAFLVRLVRFGKQARDQAILAEILVRLEELLAAKDELKALIASVVASVEEVKADIADLISKLPAEGGMTADEVAEVKSDLESLLEKAQDAADDHTV